MEIKGLFDSLADYINFSVNFLLFGGLDEYARKGSVNATLVSYMLIGLFIAYLVAYARRMPTYETSPKDEHQGGEASSSHDEVKVFQVDMARYVLLTIPCTALFHGFLLLYSRAFHSPDVATFKDTLNGVTVTVH